MIDFVRLRRACELAEKRAKITNNTVNITLSYSGHDDSLWLYDSCLGEKDFGSIDDLILKLEEIEEPEEKYKVGQKIWVQSHKIDCENVLSMHAFEGTVIPCLPCDYGLSEPYVRVIAENDQYSGPKSFCFPSRQDLIESQIAYWQSMHPDNQLKFNNGGTGFAVPTKNGKCDCKTDYFHADDGTCVCCCSPVAQDPCDELEPVPESEILLGHISALQSEVNDLKWRMNEVCNTLSLKEKTGWDGTLIREGTNPCEHDYINTTNSYRRCSKCLRPECKHESDGEVYMLKGFRLNEPSFKCIKCGEFYR